MDKYLIIVLVMLVMGMIFAVTKGLNILQNLILFYSQMAGAIGVILYASYKDRKKHQNAKRKRL